MKLRGNKTGQHWERIASSYLHRRGVEILARGFSCRFGEIDLIGRDGEEIVLFEIKARRRGAIVSPLESIDQRKRRSILRTARYFLLKHPRLAQRPLRLDAIGIADIDSRRPRIEWIKNAFDAT